MCCLKACLSQQKFDNFIAHTGSTVARSVHIEAASIREVDKKILPSQKTAISTAYSVYQYRSFRLI